MLSQNIIKSIDWACAATKKVFVPGITKPSDATPASPKETPS